MASDKKNSKLESSTKNKKRSSTKRSIDSSWKIGSLLSRHSKRKKDCILSCKSSINKKSSKERIKKKSIEPSYKRYQLINRV